MEKETVTYGNLVEIQDGIESLMLRLRDYARLVNVLSLGMQSLEADDEEYTVSCFRIIERSFTEAEVVAENILKALENINQANRNRETD